MICTADKKSKHSNELIESPIKYFCKKNEIPFTQLPVMPYSLCIDCSVVTTH